MNTGTCPKCNKLITNVQLEDISIVVNVNPAWRGISYVCPFCRTILGVGIDPVALKTDLLHEISGVLQGKMR